MRFDEWAKAVAGTAREHLGVAAASLCVLAAMGFIAAGSFTGCRASDAAAPGAATASFPVAEAPATVASPSPKPASKPHPAGSLIVYVTGAVKRPGVYTLNGDARLYHAVRAAGGFKQNAVTDALNLADRAQDGDQLCIPARKSARSAPPLRHTLSPAPQRPPQFAAPALPIIRKTTLPAPVVLPSPPDSPGETAPVVAVIPPTPGRILGAPSSPPEEPTVASPMEAPPPVIAQAPFPAAGTISLPPAPRKPARTASKSGVKFKNPGDGIVHINSATAAELEQLPRCGPAMSAKILAYRAQIGGKFTDIKQLMDVKGCGEKTFEKWQPFLAL